MQFSSLARRRARYLVPVGAAAVTAAVVFVPQAASGAQHPNLPEKTAAQLLASLEQMQPPQFSGTVVETAHLGLPNIDPNQLPAGVTPQGQAPLMQVVTLLTGSHTAQIAYGGPDRQRVAIFLSDLSEADIVHNGTDLWTYSSDSNSVTHSTVKRHGEGPATPDATTPVDPTKAAEQALAKIDPSTAVTVDRTAQVAGRPAYRLDLNPRDPRTLVSSVQIAIDAETSLPLQVQVWARNHPGEPAFSVGFTDISMSAPNPSTFDFSQPPGANLAPAPFSSQDRTQAPKDGGDRVATAPEQQVQPGQQEPGVTTVGKDWTTVLVSHTDPSGLGQQIDKLGTQVDQGHLLSTALVSILLTTDNRLLVGAVTPSYLEEVAASQAAQ